MSGDPHDHRSPEEERAEFERTLSEVDNARKQLRENAKSISKAEEAARQDRIRVERAADDLDCTYINLTPLRDVGGVRLSPWLSQIRMMASSATVSGDVAADAYYKLQSFFTDVRTITSGIVASAGTANYLSTEAYYEARQYDVRLGPEAPSSNHPSLYVEDVATADQKELESLLSELASHLGEKLRGARAALASNQPDHIGQAYTSMQELLDQVLHHFSDDVVGGERIKDGRVKKASWWKPDPKDGVTRPHRVRFVIQDDAPEVDPETDRRIKAMIEQARALGGIQAEKHRHGSGGEGQKNIGLRHMAALEAFLLFLLRNRRAEIHQ
jgi:hypothetical protein